METLGLMPLSQVPEGARVWVNRLPLHPDLERRLLAMGVRPGVEIQVLRRGHPGGLLHLASGLTEFMLRGAQAAELQVSLLPPG